MGSWRLHEQRAQPTERQRPRRACAQRRSLLAGAGACSAAAGALHAMVPKAVLTLEGLVPGWREEQWSRLLRLLRRLLFLLPSRSGRSVNRSSGSIDSCQRCGSVCRRHCAAGAGLGCSAAGLHRQGLQARAGRAASGSRCGGPGAKAPAASAAIAERQRLRRCLVCRSWGCGRSRRSWSLLQGCSGRGTCHADISSAVDCYVILLVGTSCQLLHEL